MPDIDVKTLEMLRGARKYRYIRFNQEGVLQGAKSDGDSRTKKEWCDLKRISAAGSFRIPVLQELDLDSI